MWSLGRALNILFVKICLCRKLNLKKRSPARLMSGNLREFANCLRLLVGRCINYTLKGVPPPALHQPTIRLDKALLACEEPAHFRTKRVCEKFWTKKVSINYHRTNNTPNDCVYHWHTSSHHDFLHYICHEFYAFSHFIRSPPKKIDDACS